LEPATVKTELPSGVDRKSRLFSEKKEGYDRTSESRRGRFGSNMNVSYLSGGKSLVQSITVVEEGR